MQVSNVKENIFDQHTHGQRGIEQNIYCNKKRFILK